MTNSNSDRVDALVTHACRNVEFYRNLANERGLNVPFNELPLVNKQLYNTYPSRFRCSTMYEEADVIHKRTTGSTGIPLEIVRTKREQVEFASAVWIYRRKWNVPPSSIIVTFDLNPVGQPIVLHARRDGLADIALSPTDLSDAALERGYHLLCSPMPKILFSFPTVADHFARFIRRNGLQVKPLNFCHIELNGEVAMEQQRRTIQEVFQCSIANFYGAEEFWPIAYECPRGLLHINTRQLYVELYRNELGYEELVATSLTLYLMPFIRYRLGDIVVLDRAGCDCGSGDSIIRSVTGRTYDLVRLANNRVFHPSLFSYAIGRALAGADEIISQYHVTQTSRDGFEISLITGHRFTAEICTRITQEIRQALNEAINIDFSYTDSIDTFLLRGKFQTFSSAVSLSEP